MSISPCFYPHCFQPLFDKRLTNEADCSCTERWSGKNDTAYKIYRNALSKVSHIACTVRFTLAHARLARGKRIAKRHNLSLHRKSFCATCIEQIDKGIPPQAAATALFGTGQLAAAKISNPRNGRYHTHCQTHWQRMHDKPSCDAVRTRSDDQGCQFGGWYRTPPNCHASHLIQN